MAKHLLPPLKKSKTCDKKNYANYYLPFLRNQQGWPIHGVDQAKSLRSSDGQWCMEMWDK